MNIKPKAPDAEPNPELDPNNSPNKDPTSDEKALEELLGYCDDEAMAMVEQLKKTQFVALLGKLFKSYGLWDVNSMQYITDGMLIEKVVVIFNGGYNISVNVRMDSNEAIVKDVIKALENWR